ncbi:MAG: hypothetical protein A4E71_00736 [Smithella sp. PtaU1.Bin162]|nr:MAG: hypothetical protein A4E71_00736 [Smithella sp. PtaU1.Bin162]
MIGGGNNTDIHFFLFGSADLIKFFILQKPKQLDLGGKRQFADFVEKQCAAVGKFTFAFFAVLKAAGKCSFFITEKFTLHQIFTDGTAIDADQRFAHALAPVVNHLGQHFFSRSRLTFQENRRIITILHNIDHL